MPNTAFRSWLRQDHAADWGVMLYLRNRRRILVAAMLFVMAQPGFLSAGQRAVDGKLRFTEECISIDARPNDVPEGKSCASSKVQSEVDDQFMSSDDVQNPAFSTFGSTLTITEDGDHNVIVRVNGREVAYFKDPGGVDEPIKAALWNGHDWVLEYLNRVLVSGHDIGAERGYDDVFFYRYIDERPFYFFTRHDRLVGVSFDGVDQPVKYDAVAYGLCCSNGVYNPTRSMSAVRFFGRRGDTWYEVIARARMPLEEEKITTLEGFVNWIEPGRSLFQVGSGAESWSLDVSSQSVITFPDAKPLYGAFGVLHLGQPITVRFRMGVGGVQRIDIKSPGQATAAALSSKIGDITGFDEATGIFSIKTYPPNQEAFSCAVTSTTRVLYNGLASTALDLRNVGYPASIEFQQSAYLRKAVAISVLGPARRK